MNGYIDYLETIEQGLYDEREALREERPAALKGLHLPPAVQGFTNAPHHLAHITIALIPALSRYAHSRIGLRAGTGPGSCTPVRNGPFGDKGRHAGCRTRGTHGRIIALPLLPVSNTNAQAAFSVPPSSAASGTSGLALDHGRGMELYHHDIEHGL